jgi:hypothetical protein
MKKFAGLVSGITLAFTVGCAQTDAGITTKVQAKFASDDMVKAYQIDVDTKDHVVTLTGDVESSAAKERAVQIASTTEGVRNVVDNLVVRDTAATSGEIDRDISAEKTGDAVSDAAEKTGSAVKKGATTVKEGAEKVGSKIVDAVTDKDRDSDKDGH